MSYGQRSRESLNELHSIKVDDIPSDCKEVDLERSFDTFGKIADVYIPRDFGSQRAKGFAFVRFERKDDAERACDGKVEVLGRSLYCTMATRQKEDMTGRGRSRSRKRGGGRKDSRGRGGGRGGGRKDSRRGGGRDRSRGGRKDSRRR